MVVNATSDQRTCGSPMSALVCSCGVGHVLAVSDRSGGIGRPVLDGALRACKRVLDLASELLGFLGQKLPRFRSGLGRKQQRDAGADQRADNEDREAASWE